jgi:hypothetical protein
VDLKVLIEPKLELARLSQVLDELGHEGRLHAVRLWTPHVLATLYEALAGYRPLTLDGFVPSATPPRTEVIHHGKNSLPAASHFQKRFFRPAPVEPEPGQQEGHGKLFGYNEQTFRPFTGPGYFETHADAATGEVVFDYRVLPPADPAKLPAGWPPVVSNTGRLGFLVYAGMVDRCRALADHVVVGKAFKRGRPMRAWFALVREDRAP